VVVVLVGVLATPLAADVPTVGQAATDDGTPTADGPDPDPGAHLSGVVGVRDGLVRGTLAAETFGARLETAVSPGERARLVDQRLNETERRLDAARTRVDKLDAAREGGSLDGDTYTARLAAVGERVRGLQAVTDATASAGGDLPAEQQAALNLEARLERIRTRAASLRERTERASAAVDGAGEEIRARPLSTDRIEAVMSELTGASASFRDVLGSTRINVHVQRANGDVIVVGVRTAEGQVADVSVEPFDNPGVAVYTDYRVVGQIQRADDSAAELEAAFRDGRIRYDGQGVSNSLKYGLVKLVSTVTGAVLWLVPALGRRD